MDEEEYHFFLASLAVIRTAIITWQGLGSITIKNLPGSGGKNLIDIIRDALRKCPDEYPSPETSELGFIDDEELSDSLRIDLSLVNRALSNGVCQIPLSRPPEGQDGGLACGEDTGGVGD